MDGKGKLGKLQRQRADKLLQLKRLKAKQDKAAYIDPEKARRRRSVVMSTSRMPSFPKRLQSTRRPSSATHQILLTTLIALRRTKLMDFVKAVDDSKMAIEKDPKFTKAWMRKAGCEYFMKEYHKAIDSYKAVLAYDENNEEAKKGLERTVRKVNESSGGEMDAKASACNG